MAQQVAVLLREWRGQRQMSLGGLALRSGIHKSTLSRWESGVQQPGVRELEAVLDAFDATPQQRAQALAAVDAPRAVQRLRQLSTGAPPVGGDLLRAIRQRRGQTQSEVAAKIGVQQNTLARWERGEVWPSTEKLHQLCYVLGAREEELTVLTRGRWLATEKMAASLDELREEFIEIVFMPERDTLRDLRFLALEARLWYNAARDELARAMLSNLYARHVLHLIERESMSEAQTFGRWMHKNEAMRQEPTRVWTLVFNASARLAVYGGRRPNPQRGVQILRAAQHLPIVPMNRAWTMSELAEYVALAGEMDTAIAISRRACRIAEQEAAPIEVWHRKRNMAQILIQAGRPAEALPLIPAEGLVDYGPVRIEEALLWAETLLALGKVSEANDWLQRAYADMNTLELFSLRPKADALSLRFPEPVLG